MDDPDDLKQARASLVQARADLKYYRELAMSYYQRLQQMTSAASGAAASTVTAIERLQLLQRVVDAAIEWRTYAAYGEATGELNDAEEALWEAVDTYRIEKARWS